MKGKEIIFSLEKERLLIKLKEAALSLSEDHKLNSQEISQAIADVIPSFSPSLENDAILVPLSLFVSDCSPLQALVAFLHEHKQLSFKEISLLLDKSYRSVSQVYRQGVIADSFSDEFLIPLKKFFKHLSILESIVHYLHVDCLLTFSKIASFLNKDPRTIWTTWDRAQKKIRTGVLE